MKSQTALRFACFFAVNLAASLHAASVIQFTATSYTVAEDAGQATITVQRTADLDTPVSVDFATVDGTATSGLKYTALSGTLPSGPMNRGLKATATITRSLRGQAKGPQNES